MATRKRWSVVNYSRQTVPFRSGGEVVYMPPLYRIDSDVPIEIPEDLRPYLCVLESVEEIPEVEVPKKKPVEKVSTEKQTVAFPKDGGKEDKSDFSDNLKDSSI